MANILDFTRRGGRFLADGHGDPPPLKILRIENVVTEIEPNRYAAEASALGLPPGKWPVLIETDLGNGQPFMFERKQEDADGDATVVDYRQRNGVLRLTVFND